MKGLKSQVEHKKNGRRLMNHHIQVNFRHDKSQLASNYDDLDLYLSLYSPKARWIAFGYGAGFFGNMYTTCNLFFSTPLASCDKRPIPGDLRAFVDKRRLPMVIQRGQQKISGQVGIQAD